MANLAGMPPSRDRRGALRAAEGRGAALGCRPRPAGAADRRARAPRPSGSGPFRPTARSGSARCPRRARDPRKGRPPQADALVRRARLRYEQRTFNDALLRLVDDLSRGSTSSTTRSTHMRLAVCMPQVPFERGGTEIFADGLVQALREHGHETELVTIPFKWYPGERVLTQAFLWRLLDLEEANGRPIDAVIATKFPSYASGTAQGGLASAPVPAGLGARPDRARPVLGVGRGPRAPPQGAQPRPRRARRGAPDLHHVVDRRRPARASRPGSTPRCSRRRPRRSTSTATGYDDFILSVNRLDRAKRIDLLIEAAAPSPRPPGGDRRRRSRPRAPRAARPRARPRRPRHVHGSRQRRRARRSLRPLPRRLLRACRRGLRARAVQAFLSEKPVITTTDAGGPLEVVHDGRPGASSRPTRPSSAGRAAWLREHPDEARAVRPGRARRSPRGDLGSRVERLLA